MKKEQQEQSQEKTLETAKKKKQNPVKKQYSHFTVHFMVTALLFVIQVVFVISVLFSFVPNISKISLVLPVISLFCSLLVVASECDYGYKISWVLGICILPLIFVPLYFLFGTGAIKRKMSRRYEKTWIEDTRLVAQNPEVLAQFEKEVHPKLRLRIKSLSRNNHIPIYSSTRTDYLKNGTEYFDSVCEAIYNAEDFIFLEFFIISYGEIWDRILKLLRDKANQGVEVRIIYDDLATAPKIDSRYSEELREMGFKVTKFNKFRPFLSASANYRDHRKLIIVDGKVGFCGGINIGDEYANIVQPYGIWKDTGLRLEGEGVQAMTLEFLHQWDFNLNQKSDFSHYLNVKRSKIVGQGFVIPYTDHPTIEGSISMSVYMNLINSATHSIYLTTPYLVPDENIMSALLLAAKNGVSVNIITPSIPDKKYVFAVTRSNYEKLLKAGARIFEFKDGFIHAKSIVVDDIVAVVGSTNMDYRSLYLNYENGCLIYETPSVADVADDLKKICREGNEITLKNTEIIKYSRNLFVMILKLLSPML